MKFLVEAKFANLQLIFRNLGYSQIIETCDTILEKTNTKKNQK